MNHLLLAFCTALAVLSQPLTAQTHANENSARQMRLEMFVVPDFPGFLRQSGVREGTVVVAIAHDATGKASDILVLESTEPRFTEAALDAIRQWRFESPMKPPVSRDAAVPVVRFLFTSGSVAIVPLALGAYEKSRLPVRAGSPIELPNFGHCDTEPKALAQPLPKFPAELKGRVARGMALVKFFVDETGRARVPVAIHATEPEFGGAAVAAVAQWRFAPPRIDAKPVIVIETRTFHFGSPDGS